MDEDGWLTGSRTFAMWPLTNMNYLTIYFHEDGTVDSFNLSFSVGEYSFTPDISAKLDFSVITDSNRRLIAEPLFFLPPDSNYTPDPSENLITVERWTIVNGRVRLETEQITENGNIRLDCHAFRITNCKRNICQIGETLLDNNEEKMFDFAPILPGMTEPPKYDGSLRVTFRDGKTANAITEKYGTQSQILKSLSGEPSMLRSNLTESEAGI
ncbi:MAG: hypothetical protein V4543_08420 [Bacteroidota bacterium]